MSDTEYQIRQICDEVVPPQSGKQSVVILDDDQAKVVAFAFSSGSGLAEHVAPMHAIIQIVSGDASLTVGDESVQGKAGTLIEMQPKTPHSIHATTPVVMLLTLLKTTS